MWRQQQDLGPPWSRQQGWICKSFEALECFGAAKLDTVLLDAPIKMWEQLHIIFVHSCALLVKVRTIGFGQGKHGMILKEVDRELGRQVCFSDLVCRCTQLLRSA